MGRWPDSNQFTFAYDALGRRTQLTRPNGVNTNYAYDNLSRLLSVLHQAGSTTLDGATYTYDHAGNRMSKLNHLNSVLETYSYDNIYQLIGVLQGSTPSEAYSYDLVGNRLSTLTDSGWTYNNSNQLISRPGVTYTYDNNGNTVTKTDSNGTTTYTWDYENRLVSVALPGSGGTVTFRYDSFGRRIQKVSTSGTVNFAYDRVNIAEEVDGAASVLARYVHGPGIDEPLALGTGASTRFYHADGLGSVTTLADTAASLTDTYVTDSFGKAVASTGSTLNGFRYTARERDPETNLYFHRARYYDHAQGRFLGEDAIGFMAEPNFYIYARNNPQTYFDPFGNDIWLEGPSGREPAGHLSINVGDPYGNYSSFSFGVNGEPTTCYFGLGLEAEVYEDVSPGGEFYPGYYLSTTPEEDALALQHLQAQLGNEACYRPWRTCRNFSFAQFEHFVRNKIGKPKVPDPRPRQPRGYNVPALSSSTASDPVGSSSSPASSSSSPRSSSSNRRIPSSGSSK